MSGTSRRPSAAEMPRPGKEPALTPSRFPLVYLAATLDRVALRKLYSTPLRGS